MTCYPLWNKASERIIPIGIAGGWAKASTGYTFKRSERKAQEINRIFEDWKAFGSFWWLGSILVL